MARSTAPPAQFGLALGVILRRDVARLTSARRDDAVEPSSSALLPSWESRVISSGQACVRAEPRFVDVVE